MIGERFGKWMVISEVESNKENKRYLCKCDCSGKKIILAFTLKNGTSTQCIHCYINRSHRKSQTSTYRVWCGLFTRCYNENHATYKYYGAKGIRVSNDWRIFRNFFRDMGERPEGYQIDRIDPTKDYSNNNCRWLPKKDNNKRQHNRLIDMAGMKFGKWTVFDRDVTKLDHDQAYWHCVCDCGKNQSITGHMLRSGKTRQCLDCKHKEHSKIHSGWNKRKLNKDMKII